MKRSVEEGKQPDHAAHTNQPVLLGEFSQRCDRERGQNEDQSPIASRVCNDFDWISTQTLMKCLPGQSFQWNECSEENQNLCNSQAIHRNAKIAEVRRQK